MIRALVTGLAGSMLFASGSAHATLIHSYDFDTDLSDSIVGGTSLLQSFTAGGTGSAAGGLYTFTPGGGLTLNSQLPGTIYTIELRVALSQVSGYRKLVSFENITDDRGLYNLNGSLNLFNVANSATNTDFAPDTFVDVQISRDGAGLVTGFINGVQKFSYSDTSAIFTASNALFFVRDDLAQNAEQSGGVLDYLRIYDTATPSVSAVPEPASWAMMILGFGVVGAGLRRRSTVSARVRFA